MKVSLIAAMSKNRVIGKDNDLPWHLPKDLKHFKNTTHGHHVIMGRLTYESQGRLLPGRTNIILTRQPDFEVEGAIMASSIEEALDICRKKGEEEAFIIGGQKVFEQSLDIADRIYLTVIDHTFFGDAFFPELEDRWKEVSSEHHEADEKNKWNFDIKVLEKR